MPLSPAVARLPRLLKASALTPWPPPGSRLCRRAKWLGPGAELDESRPRAAGVPEALAPAAGPAGQVQPRNRHQVQAGQAVQPRLALTDGGVQVGLVGEGDMPGVHAPTRSPAGPPPPVIAHPRRLDAHDVPSGRGRVVGWVVGESARRAVRGDRRCAGGSQLAHGRGLGLPIRRARRQTPDVR